MTAVASMYALLAQAASAAQIGSGKIQGGWEYVWGAYSVFWLALALYAAALWTRRAKDARPRGEG